jgi:hypothetical protein
MARVEGNVSGIARNGPNQFDGASSIIGRSKRRLAPPSTKLDAVDPVQREMRLRQLAEANRHIAESQQRIDQLRSRIEQRERDGRDSSNLSELLRLCEDALDLLIDHRRAILLALKGRSQLRH